jgi:polysaccharide export outer membrane protein
MIISALLHGASVWLPTAGARWIKSICLVLLAIATAGCVDSGSIAASKLSSTPAVSQNDYHIGAGDQLKIFVWRNEDLSTAVVVRPDGKISMPLVNDMVAAGKTPSQLTEDLTKVLSEYVRSPKVNVIVVSFVGTFSDQIRVVGEAGHPKVIAYRAGMTILDVMLEAGGLAEHASGNKSKVLRTVGGKTQKISVKLNDLLYEGDVTQNIAMLPGDVVVVPLSIF